MFLDEGEPVNKKTNNHQYGCCEARKYFKEAVAGLSDRITKIWHHQRIQELCHVPTRKRRISYKCFK